MSASGRTREKVPAPLAFQERLHGRGGRAGARARLPPACAVLGRGGRGPASQRGGPKIMGREHDDAAIGFKMRADHRPHETRLRGSSVAAPASLGRSTRFCWLDGERHGAGRPRAGLDGAPGQPGGDAVGIQAELPGLRPQAVAISPDGGPGHRGKDGRAGRRRPVTGHRPPRGSRCPGRQSSPVRRPRTCSNPTRRAS